MGLRVVIAAAGDVVEPGDLASSCREADLVIAADGGLDRLREAGVVPDLLIGDLDSLAGPPPEGVELKRSPREKDATDLELALREAVARGAEEIHVFGALGDRFDHALATINYLERFDIAIVLHHGPTTLRLVSDRFEDRGEAGELVSLIPLTEVARGVRTWGLKYALHGEDLQRASTRGVSNEVVSSPWGLAVEAGKILVVHGPTPEEVRQDG